MAVEHISGASAAGIHRIALPTPFAVGRVNVYLIEDEPLALVDAGFRSKRSLAELERGLSALGRSVEDVELLLLTHQHVDHFGLAADVVARSGARVAALAETARFVERYDEEAAADDEFAAELMARHGIGAAAIADLREATRRLRGWGAAVGVDRVL